MKRKKLKPIEALISWKPAAVQRQAMIAKVLVSQRTGNSIDVLISLTSRMLCQTVATFVTSAKESFIQNK